MSQEFQTVLKTNVGWEKRKEAIDRLAGKGERRTLSLLVQTGGLDGEFRRQALEALSKTNASEQLGSLADDRSVPESLRRRAAEVA